MFDFNKSDMTYGEKEIILQNWLVVCLYKFKTMIRLISRLYYEKYFKIY